MNTESGPPAAGLYLVATPIGNARDITLRALELLAGAEILVAEDTRSLRKLMQIHGLSVGDRPLWAHHDHGGSGSPARVAEAVLAGRSVVYASEAGTPGLSDPGLALVRAVVAAGGAVTAAPGPAAALTALTLSGLPTGRVLFLGFPPPKAGDRARLFQSVANVSATLVFYEAPGRVYRTLSELVSHLGEDREAAMARELTKKFEEVRRAPLGALAASLAEDRLRGEVVVLVGPPTAQAAVDPAALDAALVEALAEASLRDAVAAVTARFGLPRRQVYDRALALSSKNRENGAE